MIRKAIIVLLTLAAIVVAIGFLFSIVVPPGRLPERTCLTPNGVEVTIPASGIALFPGRFAAQVIREDQQRARTWGGGFAGLHMTFTNGTSVVSGSQGVVASKNFSIAQVDLPLWMPFVLFVAYPTVVFIRGPYRRYRRRRKGLCLKCAYDLTGNVSGVCSECGTELEQHDSLSRHRLGDAWIARLHLKMQVWPRHYHLLGGILTVAAYCALLGACWYGLNLAPEEVAGVGILLGALFVPVLATLLFPQFRRQSESAWLTTRRTLHHTRWGACSGLSFVLLVLVTLAWMLSHCRADEFALAWGPTRLIRVISARGALLIDNDVYPPGHGKSGVSWHVGYSPYRTGGPSHGFAVLSGRATSGPLIFFVEVPWWCPAALLLIAPALTIRRGYRRLRRDTANCCRRCGHNLTGNVSGVCPECGTGRERR